MTTQKLKDQKGAQVSVQTYRRLNVKWEREARLFKYDTSIWFTYCNPLEMSNQLKGEFLCSRSDI